MAWVRKGKFPEKIKVSFEVDSKTHPELAKFIWNLPYRSTSQVLRDLLSSAVSGDKKDTEDIEGIEKKSVTSDFIEKSERHLMDAQKTTESPPSVVEENPKAKPAEEELSISKETAATINKIDSMFS